LQMSPSARQSASQVRASAFKMGFDLCEGLLNQVQIRIMSRQEQDQAPCFFMPAAAFQLMWIAKSSRITTSPLHKVGTSCVSM
jgi:hypothetical protein